MTRWLPRAANLELMRRSLEEKEIHEDQEFARNEKAVRMPTDQLPQRPFESMRASVENAMTHPLVLSLFPGIGFLDRAFEDEGFCVVRGPDVIWGGDIRRFHVGAGLFDGIIGGPPCQPFSPLVRIVRARGKEPRHGNLIPEFERVVDEARPRWFLMEESPNAPLPVVAGYVVRQRVINNRWLGETQNRERRFSFGTADGLNFGAIEYVALMDYTWHHAVTSTSRAVPIAIGGSGKRKKGLDARTGPRASLGDMLELQGFPRTMPGRMPVDDGRQETGDWQRRSPGDGPSCSKGDQTGDGLCA